MVPRCLPASFVTVARCWTPSCCSRAFNMRSHWLVAVMLGLEIPAAGANPTARLNRLGGLRSYGARGLAEELPGAVSA